MKKWLFSILFLSAAFQIYAQNKQIDRLVYNLNNIMADYSQMSFMGSEMEAIEEHPFSRKELKKLVEGTDEEIFSANKDSVERWTLLAIYAQRIDTLLLQIIHSEGFIDYPIEEKLDIEMSVSADRKLWCFNYPANNGGTYYQVYGIMAFASEDGMITNFEYPFNSDGYFSIDTIHRNDEVLYVLNAAIKGCSTCNYQSLEVVSWNGKSFNEVFSLHNESRMWDAVLEYLPETHTIHLEYDADDLNGGCICEDIYGEVLSEDDYDYMQGIKCKQRYKFNGQTFEIVEFSMTKEN